jgi:hypothetical protein
MNAEDLLAKERALYNLKELILDTERRLKWLTDTYINADVKEELLRRLDKALEYCKTAEEKGFRLV